MPFSVRGEDTNFGSREVTEGKIRFNPVKPLKKLIKATPQLRFSEYHSPKIIADPFFWAVPNYAK